MNDSIFASSVRFLWKDLFGDLIAFPFWWYTKGTLRVVQFILRRAHMYAQSLSLRIWVKNLFVPMYSQYDFAGRVISFFLRIAVLVYRLILFVIWFFILLAMLGVWMFGPIAVVVYILYQVAGVDIGL